MRDLATIKIIGERMRQAREIAGYSQTKAAKLLGYKNSSRLNKIECATDVASISIDTIVKSAKVYDVSTDFILGLSDDWERDAQLAQCRDISKYLHEVWSKHHERDINAIRQISNRLDVLNRAVDAYDASVNECSLAITRFSELNPNFEDMKGGARVLSSIGKAESTVYNAKALLRRFKLDCQIAGGNNLQLGLLDGTFD